MRVLLHVSVMREPLSYLQYCFALCKINLFSVKPLWGFILVSSETMFLAVIVFRKTICFWLCRSLNCWERESYRLSFLYRELRRFSNNASQRLWLNLVKLQLFYQSEVFDCKRRFGWLGLCDASQSISLSSRVAFTGWKSLSNCVDLKETLGVLKTV